MDNTEVFDRVARQVNLPKDRKARKEGKEMGKVEEEVGEVRKDRTCAKKKG